ncbi:MAG TPA: M20/M25/M40 family metallo-hydrolase [Verrucomicrobiae bacterium]|jgi:carboxypeptidase Q|nr:M20/M25/M40 family metallo-hydrolase [Verrucomicrobiae bacterium]
MFLSLPMFLLAVASAQNPVDQVIAEALKPSPLEINLRKLTDEIGGRVPGTLAMRQAVDWGVAGFKAAGADNVHTENFTIPAAWAEGFTRMSISAPERFDVRVVSMAWAPAMPARQDVPVIDVGEGKVEDFNKAGNVSGALLLVHSNEMAKWDDLFAEYLRAPGIILRARQAKALAIAFQSTRPHDLLYRHTDSLQGEIGSIPAVLVAREDADRMARLLASGQKLRADLAIPNRVGGPITASNVVAEIRGSEKPSEFVILGAHLDSWELGTGALDNGCNAALVIDALRAIKTAGLRPRRSIRFILFSGEEEGLVGSHAYAIAHRKELDKAAGVVIFDSGTGRVTGFSLGGRKDVVDAANKLVAPLKQFDAATLLTTAEWGTDHFDFLLEGVPTFVAEQEEANYLINYHAMSDTFDKVDLAQLKKHVAEAAALTFAIAYAPERIGPRLHHAQIEQTMVETHLDELMKTFGMWQPWQEGKWGRAD